MTLSTSDRGTPSDAAGTVMGLPPFVELGRSRPGPARPTPKICVLLATHERLGVLQECLAAFCDQTAPPGDYEILVVDDGSTDGTPEWLAATELPCSSLFLGQKSGGAAAARNNALPFVTAPLLLFVNDDTIPLREFVAGHIAAHERFGDRPAVALGSFVQPPEALELAFVRLLEETNYVFCYADIEPGDVVGGTFFYTCNVSVPTAAVHAAGDFDMEFWHYGCEDTDLGLRLERMGYGIHYLPELKAIHRHVPDFDATRRRAAVVARAHVRLLRKFPALIEDGKNLLTASRQSLSATLEENAAVLDKACAAARSLANVNLSRLELAGGDFAATGARLAETLKALLPGLNSSWWMEGYLVGLAECGYTGFRDLMLRAPLAWTDVRPKVVLLRASSEPQSSWLRQAEAWIAQRGERAGDRAGDRNGDAEWTLLVWPAPANAAADGKEAGTARETPESIEEQLAPALGRAARRALAPSVAVLDERELAEGGVLRLFAGLSAWIPSGDSWDACGRALAEELDLEILDLDGADAPWPLPTSAPWRVFAWPDWSDAASLRALVQSFAALDDDPRVSILLRHDPELDGSFDLAAQALEAEFEHQYGACDPPRAVSVVLLGEPLAAADWTRVARSVDAWLELPPSSSSCAPCATVARASALRALADEAVPALAHAAAARAWKARESRFRVRALPRARRRELAHARTS